PGSDIAEITSDVNGHYSYTFDADPDNYYHLILREENYQGYSFVTSFEPGGGPYFKQKPIVVGETNNLNLNPATVVSLKVHAIGDTGADSAEIYLQHDKIAYFNINGAKMFSSEEADFQPAHSPSGLWEIKVKSWTSG